MASETFTIQFRSDGSRTVQRDIGSIGESANAATSSLYLLKRSLATIGAGALIKELASLADGYTNVQNRLRLVTKSSGELQAVMDELYQSSQRTRTSFESNGELYNRLSQATKGLGLSQRQTLDITETLNQAVTASGAGTREANNALIQLSQGLNSGRLAGDELRSVLEQLPVVADIIAKQMGVTRGELRKLGKDGKITTDVIIKAFQNAREEVAGRFATTVPTLGQAFIVLRNAVQHVVAEFNTATGATATLARGMILIAANADTIAKVVAPLGAAMLAAFASRALLAGINATTAAIYRLTLAMARNPFLALVVVIVALITLLYEFRDAINLTPGGLATLGDLFRAFGEQVVPILKGVYDSVVRYLGPLGKQIDDYFKNFNVQDFVLSIAQGVDTILATLAGLAATIPVIMAGIVPAMKDLGIQAVNGLIFAIRDGSIALDGIFNTILTKAQQAGQDTGDYFSTMFAAGLADTPGTILGIFDYLWSALLFATDAALKGAVAIWNSLPGALKDVIIQGLNGMIDAAESGINELIVVFVKIPGQISDQVSSGIQAAGELFNALPGYLASLPAAIGEIFRAAMATALSYVAAGINQIIAAFNSIPGVNISGIAEGTFDTVAHLEDSAGALGKTLDGIKDKYSKLAEDGTRILNLPRIQNNFEGDANKLMDGINNVITNGFTNESKGASERLGAAVGEAFNQGFSANGKPVENFTRDLLNRANEIGKDRKEAGGQGAVDLNVPGDASNVGKSSGGGGKKGGGGHKKTFEDYANNLRNENQVLRENISVSGENSKVIEIQNGLKRALTDSEKALITQLALENDALKKAQSIYADLKKPAYDYQVTLQALNELLKQGKITQGEYNDELTKGRIAFLDTQKDFGSGIERGFLKIAQSSADLASQSEKLVTSAFDGMSDALADFVVTGKGDFKGLMEDIEKQIVKLVISSAFKSLFGGLGGGSGGGILGGLFGGGGSSGGGIFGGLFGGGGAAATGGFDLGAGATAFTGFATGGSFEVGGNGGTDSQMVQFRATPNERVDILTPAQQAERDGGNSGGDTNHYNINMKIVTPDAGSFQRSRSQVISQLAVELARAKQRNT